MKLQGKDITKSYGSNLVLDAVDLDLIPGEIVGLLGRNGAGKSTLLKIISGINLPDAGTIEFEDARVGYLSERNPLYGHMYVREYLSCIASLQQVTNRRDRISFVLEKVGLNDALGKKINQLSKGYRQRVGLAATLLADPEVLILDEPISGLDPVQINDYRNLIQAIASDKIIILSSHLMQEIEALCDRILLLKDGKIVADRYIKGQGMSEAVVYHLITNRPLDTTIFGKIEGVMNCKEEDPLKYHLEIRDDQTVVEAIFDSVVDTGVKILELKRSTHSLSQLFQV